MQAQCMICRVNNGILKEINEKNWVHILCGLFSPAVKLLSYRTLEMKLVTQENDNEF